MSGDSLAAVAARAAVKQAVRQASTVWEPGTVVAVNGGTATVTLDSDPSLTPIPVGILAPNVAVGSRVQIITIPPSTKWILGVVGGGVNAAASPTLQTKTGSTVVTTNAAGGGIVTYASPFPAGTVTQPVVCMGDNNITDLAVQVIQSQVSNVGFGFQCFVANTGAGVNDNTVRINWMTGVVTG